MNFQPLFHGEHYLQQLVCFCKCLNSRLVGSVIDDPQTAPGSRINSDVGRNKMEELDLPP